MKILAIESSGEAASVAVVADQGLLGEYNLNYKKQHSVLLMPMIEELLKNLQLSVQELDGFVVSKGPGSFTGLRIGMATAKGLAMGTSKPCVSISSLDALADSIFTRDGIICAMMDALRGNVYCCLYRHTESGLTSLGDYMVISLEELSELLKEYQEHIYFVGDGAALHKDYLKASISNCILPPNHLNIPRASALGELGLKALAKGIKDDINTSSPIYLRKPQAEREYEKKMSKENE